MATVAVINTRSLLAGAVDVLFVVGVEDVVKVISVVVGVVEVIGVVGVVGIVGMVCPEGYTSLVVTKHPVSAQKILVYQN